MNFQQTMCSLDESAGCCYCHRSIRYSALHCNVATKLGSGLKSRSTLLLASHDPPIAAHMGAHAAAPVMSILAPYLLLVAVPGLLAWTKTRMQDWRHA